MELQNYSNMKIDDLKDLITTIFVIIDDIYKETIPEKIKNRRNKDKSKLTDSEIITINIVGELLTIDSENAWISFVRKNLKDLFPNMCNRTRFNRTLRNLMTIIKEIRKEVNKLFNSYSTMDRIIDSFPLPVCKFGRAHFHKTFRGYGVDYGYCASKKETYYGYKVHALITKEGFVTDYLITSASVDDREAIWELIEEYKRPLVIIGDKGYISEELKNDLRKERDMGLIYMKRNNSKDPYPKMFRQIIFKMRRRIETTFSQLVGQLNVEVVKAKSLLGLKTRLESKILGYNLSILINQLLGKEDIARIKGLAF